MRNSCSAAQNFETCLGIYRRPLRLSLLPHFRLFSNWWWPQIIDMSELKWPNIFDMTNNFWPKMYMSCYKFPKFEKWEYKNHQISWYLGPSHVLEGQDLEFLVKKLSWDQKIKKIEKSSRNFWCQNVHVVLQVPKIRKMRIQKSPNLMIFGPIACFRRSGSRFSGQKLPRSSEVRAYIENTGHIKKSWNFQNIILVPGVQKNDF